MTLSFQKDTRWSIMWLKHRHNKTTYDEEGSVSSGPGVKHSSSKSIASQRTTHTRGSSRKNGRNRNSQAAVRRGRSIDIDDNKSAVTASALTIVLPSTSPLAESSEPERNYTLSPRPHPSNRWFVGGEKS